MTSCPNADVRDLLPDWVSGRIAPAERAAVEAHLAGCASCRDEVGLLAAVRHALPSGPRLDTARIVAALPAPPARARALGAHAVRRPVWQNQLWRAAAVVTAVVTGGAALLLGGGREGVRSPVAVAVGAESLGTSRTSAGSAPAGAQAGRTPTATRARPGGLRASGEADAPLLAFVDAEEMTAAEYEALVTDLEADADLFAPVVEIDEEPLTDGGR